MALAGGVGATPGAQQCQQLRGLLPGVQQGTPEEAGDTRKERHSGEHAVDDAAQKLDNDVLVRRADRGVGAGDRRHVDTARSIQYLDDGQDGEHGCGGEEPATRDGPPIRGHGGDDDTDRGGQQPYRGPRGEPPGDLGNVGDVLSEDGLMKRPRIEDALVDAVALWEVSPASGAAEAIDTATEALVRGLDSPSLRELAGASPRESYWALRPLVQETLSELGISYPGPRDTDVQVAAGRAMCWRLFHGKITPRALVAWAHRTIGHEGATRLQPLVDLDDLYDEIDVVGRTVKELDEVTYAVARRIVGGQPMDPS